MISVRTPTQTPTVTASGIYASGDALGGLLTFADAVPAGNGHGGAILESVVLVDKASQSAAIDLVLFSAAITPTADNAAFDPTDTEMLTCIGVVPISSYSVFNDNSVATARGLGLVLPTTVTGSIFGQMVVRAAPTYAAVGDIQISLGVVRD